MHTSLPTFTQAQLETMKTKDIAVIYNTFAAELGIKLVSRFANKTTCIDRTLSLQEDYTSEVLAEVVAETSFDEPEIVEPIIKDTKRQTRFDLNQIVMFTEECEPTQGTIEFSLKQAIIEHEDGAKDEWTVTAGQILDYVLNNHKRPRSGLGVDEQYVIHNLKWFIKKGSLKIVQA